MLHPAANPVKLRKRDKSLTVLWFGHWGRKAKALQTTATPSQCPAIASSWPFRFLGSKAAAQVVKFES